MNNNVKGCNCTPFSLYYGKASGRPPFIICLQLDIQKPIDISLGLWYTMYVIKRKKGKKKMKIELLNDKTYEEVKKIAIENFTKDKTCVGVRLMRKRDSNDWKIEYTQNISKKLLTN
jgi:hypothetical protein